MCGRFSVHHLADALLFLFDLHDAPEYPPRYNIAPSQQVPVVRRQHQHRVLEPALVRWGLIPHWAGAANIGYRMINARAEGVAEKPAFRAAFRRRRCLVPAHGFYEWRKRDTSPKRPFNIRRKDGRPFAMAGLWETWTDPASGQEVQSCTIVTTAANALIEPLHNRMPVILERGEFQAWLDPADTGGRGLLPLLESRPWPEMVCEPVSLAVNDVKSDGPACVQPVAAPGPQPAPPADPATPGARGGASPGRSTDKE